MTFNVKELETRLLGNAVVVRPAPKPGAIRPMSAKSIAKVREWTSRSLAEQKQYPFVTEHRLHAGMYFRTVNLPGGAEAGFATGVLIKIPTVLIMCGNGVLLYMGEEEPPLYITGQKVLLGSAGRKQAGMSYEPWTMTMCFATKARTVAEAEAEFTDEIEWLVPLSETERHDIVVTEE